MKTIKTLWKSTPKINLIIYLLLTFGILGCSKDDAPVITSTPTPKEIELSSAKQITSFVFLLTNNPIGVNVVATIDEENKAITAAMPPGTDITGLLPEVKTSDLSTIDRDTAQNFTDPLEYTVTAEDGSEIIYMVTATALLSQRQILQAILDANPGNTLDWDLENTAELNSLNGVATNVDERIIELVMTEKELTQLPAEIGQLTNLISLELERNELSELPAEIGKLTNLTYLSFRSNELSELPPEIGQLTKLLELALFVNQLTSLPSEIGQLTRLETLVLSGNQLSSLPLEIRQLTNLEQLLLGVNQLSSLPPEIGQLTKLTELTLGNNQLTELPTEIGQLTNLTEINLTRNQLIELPPQIGLLTKLQNLRLSGNNLTSLPAEIGFLTNMEALFLNENSITTMPISICNLSLFHALEIEIDAGVTCATTSQKDALISIYSANPGNTLEWSVNNFPEVSFHENGNPKAIIMNNKNLTRIPNTIGELDVLENLTINSNNLTSLPATIGDMNMLAVIAASGNQLTTVPSELGKLKNNFALLSITNNPITSIPEEVCDLQLTDNPDDGKILTILTDPGEGCD